MRSSVERSGMSSESHFEAYGRALADSAGDSQLRAGKFCALPHAWEAGTVARTWHHTAWFKSATIIRDVEDEVDVFPCQLDGGLRLLTSMLQEVLQALLDDA